MAYGDIISTGAINIGIREMDKKGEVKEFKISYTKKTLILIFFGILFFTCAGLFFIFNAEMLASDPNPGLYHYNNPLLYKILGWVSLCFFTLLGSLAFLKFFKNPLILTVNKDGVIIPEGFVEWLDIKNIYLDKIKGKVFLRLELKEDRANAVRGGYNMFQKILASLQKRNTLSYPLFGTDVNIDELYAFIKRRIKANSSEKEK